jgi:hypothetical protein
VNTAIENVIAQQPQLFDFNNNLGAGSWKVLDRQKYVDAVVQGHPGPGHLRQGRQRGNRGQEHERFPRAIQHLDVGRLRPPRLHHDLHSCPVRHRRLIPAPARV